MAKPRKPHSPASAKKPQPSPPARTKSSTSPEADPSADLSGSEENPGKQDTAIEAIERNLASLNVASPDESSPSSVADVSPTRAEAETEVPTTETEAPDLNPDTSREAESGNAPDSFESNPSASRPTPVRPRPVPAEALPNTLPAADLSRLAPRAAKADDFEQNPLTSIPANATARMELDDDVRVREALRSVIEQGDSVKEAAKDWGVAPSSIAAWRARYQELLAHASTTPLIEEAPAPTTDGLTYIPEAAREIFTENWERLVGETSATAADFRQSPRQIFLQTSPVTSWLFTDGQLDRGILAGVSCVMIGIAILTSFLIADRNAQITVPLPEPAPRDDLVIDEAAKVATSFFQATSWEERLKYVRQPDAVRDMMKTYYQENPDGPIKDATLSLAMPARHVVNLSFDVPSQNRSHFLCVVQSKGRHLVDWESSSLYQEYRLNKLRAARSTEPTRIAVTVRKEELKDYYNYAFSDSSQWVCYQLGYPGLNLNLFGYSKRDSSDSITLDSMLGIVNQHAVVMEVRFPPDSAVDNQVEILSVLRNEWVPDEP
jgi:transposase-like protein